MPGIVFSKIISGGQTRGARAAPAASASASLPAFSDSYYGYLVFILDGFEDSPFAGLLFGFVGAANLIIFVQDPRRRR